LTSAKERVFTFGSHRGLVGVLAEPAERTDPAVPAVLLYNVGLNHRVGPYRLNVDIARHLAAAGYASLRFDLSGLGDSVARAGARSEIDRGMADVQDAMDFVTAKCGISSFVLVGLCSGVDPGHRLSVSDVRVKGAAFIDGYSYETPGYRLRVLLERGRKLLSPPRYFSWLNRRLGAAGQSLEIGDIPEIFDREYPPVDEFKRDVWRMIERDMQLLVINTGNTWFYNYAGQFKDILGIRELPRQVEVDYWPDVDHVFTAVAHRQRLVQRLGGWVQCRFPLVRTEALANVAS